MRTLSLALTALLIPAALLAQGDPMADCRRQASIATDVPVNEVDVRRNPDLGNGNFVILWDAKRRNGRTVSGFCEANRNGRIVRFERNSPGNGGGAGVSRADAEIACQGEAERRLNAARGQIRAAFDRADNATYFINWRYSQGGGRGMQGSCEIDAADGQIRRFDTGGGGGSVGGYGRGDSIQARIQSGGGDGKCTFEVEVDGVAEVEIEGDRGYLRTLSGSPARWRRLDCNRPLPGNPANFRFEGRDGRGSQNLIRDPNSNRGVALIRIEDPKNGSEGYTGDIMWR